MCLDFLIRCLKGSFGPCWSVATCDTYMETIFFIAVAYFGGWTPGKTSFDGLVVGWVFLAFTNTSTGQLEKNYRKERSTVDAR